VNSFAVSDGRTASFIKELKSVAPDQKKVLIISCAFDENTLRAARNHGASLLMTASEANTEHLLHYRRIVVTADAMETLARRTA
jgi:large subunit ribosomal protein L4